MKGRSQCENVSVPSRVSLFTLTFNPALVGAAPVHHYQDNTRELTHIRVEGFLLQPEEPRTCIILHWSSATLDAVS